MTQDEKAPSSSLLKLRQSPTVVTREDEVPAVWDVGDVILYLYEVKDVFWPGAKGLVYRVHHREWDIDLAVKSPRETPFETAEQTENFVRAADAWVGLGLFPHIVSCYYVRKLGGIPRLFLEFVTGDSLHDLIHTHRLYEGTREESLKRILDISIQFAWGLKYAHDRGVVHQNVQPSNLLLTADGVAKVKGFGLAPESPGYEPPSQQTDISSWAASVLEMFTGERPWRVEELANVALANYLESDAQLKDIPRMPAPLADLLTECLQSDLDQRPRSLAAVAATLRQIYQQETGSAYPRPHPVQANTRAEELNNRALSLLDLGKREEALSVWDEALFVKPQHAESTYNRGLTLWRTGQVTDDALVRTLKGLKHSEASDHFANYLLSLVHLERDDAKAAAEVLGDDETVYAHEEKISEALTLVRRQGLQSERPLSVLCDDEIYGPNCFSPDGKSLLLTVSGPRIMILDFTAPRSPRYLEGHTEFIHAITLSADGRYALSSSEDHTVKLWDVLSTKCLQTLTHNKWPHPSQLGLSADGRYAVLGFEWLSDEATLKLWDTSAGNELRDLKMQISDSGVSQFIFSVAISPDARYVLSGGDSRTLQLWDVESGKLVHSLEGPWGYIRFVQFSPDGTRCFAANNCEVKEFDVQSGKCLRTIEIEEYNDSKISRLTISADGNYALFGSSYGELRLWELNTGRCVRTFQDLTKDIRYTFGGSYEEITSISLSADGRYSLTGTRGGTYKLWRLNREYHAPLILSRITATEEALNNQISAEEQLTKARTALEEKRFVDAANYIRAARSVPGHERSAEALELWTSLYEHLPRTRVKASWRSHEVQGPELASSISISANGAYVLFGGFNMELREVRTGKCLRVFDKAWSGNAALSGDARLAMIGGWEQYELWDTASGELIEKRYTCHEKHVRDIRVSIDGKYAASSTEEKFDLWELTIEGFRYLASTRTDWGQVSAVAISSDNKYCVTGTGFSSMRDNDYSLKLWAIPSAECVRTFTGYDSGTYALAFTPDNKHFLGGGYDGKLRLWEVATGKCLRLFEGHTQPVDSIDISSDGKFALSGGRDHTMRLWDMASGDCLRTWEIKAQIISPVRFTADCKYILFGSGDSTLKVEALDWELEDREI